MGIWLNRLLMRADGQREPDGLWCPLAFHEVHGNECAEAGLFRGNEKVHTVEAASAASVGFAPAPQGAVHVRARRPRRVPGAPRARRHAPNCGSRPRSGVVDAVKTTLDKTPPEPPAT